MCLLWWFIIRKLNWKWLNECISVCYDDLYSVSEFDVKRDLYYDEYTVQTVSEFDWKEIYIMIKIQYNMFMIIKLFYEWNMRLKINLKDVIKKIAAMVWWFIDY